MTGSSDAAQALRAEVEAAERARQAALVAADMAALTALLAEDLIHVHSTGMVHGKAELMAHVARMGGFVSIERGTLDIRIAGDMALVAGPTVNTVRRPGAPDPVALRGFQTVALRRGPGGWQVVLSQLTPRRDPA